MAHLINSYCVVDGLQSAAGRLLNGKTCYVVKKDVANSERLAVVFVDAVVEGYATKAMASNSKSVAPYVSLKPDNLTPKFGVAVRPSTVCPSAVGKGLYATRAYKRGDVILDEVPFAAFSMEDMHSPNGGRVIAQRCMQSEPVKEALGSLRTVAPKSLVRAVRQMCGNDDDVVSWVLRAHLNHIGHMRTQTALLFPLMSRIYHQCDVLPGQNTYMFDWRMNDIDDAERVRAAKAGKEEEDLFYRRLLTASRDIAEGEELCFDYMSACYHPETRAEMLQEGWCVVGGPEGGQGGALSGRCTCSLCDTSSEAMVGLYEDLKESVMPLMMLNGNYAYTARQTLPQLLAMIKRGYAEATRSTRLILTAMETRNATRGGGGGGWGAPTTATAGGATNKRPLESLDFVKGHMVNPTMTCVLEALLMIIRSPAMLVKTQSARDGLGLGAPPSDAFKEELREFYTSVHKLRYATYCKHVGNPQHPMIAFESRRFEEDLQQLNGLLGFS